MFIMAVYILWVMYVYFVTKLTIKNYKKCDFFFFSNDTTGRTIIIISVMSNVSY